MKGETSKHKFRRVTCKPRDTFYILIFAQTSFACFCFSNEVLKSILFQMRKFPIQKVHEVSNIRYLGQVS